MSITRDADRSDGQAAVDKHQILTDISSLLAEYWARVDRVSDQPVADLYTEDGVMILGNLRVDGRSEIDAFFQKRNAAEIQKGRYTRHIVSNIRLLQETGSQVEIASTICVYAGSGALPLESASPSTIADVRDICIRQKDSSWSFLRRNASVVFVNSELAAPFTKKD